MGVPGKGFINGWIGVSQGHEGANLAPVDPQFKREVQSRRCHGSRDRLRRHGWARPSRIAAYCRICLVRMLLPKKPCEQGLQFTLIQMRIGAVQSFHHPIDSSGTVLAAIATEDGFDPSSGVVKHRLQALAAVG